MKVYVTRHGETDYNRQRKMQGYQEIPLNDRGIAQAGQLAQRFTAAAPDHIVCSDLRRAVMTGCIVAAATGTPMTYCTDLRERNPGLLVESDYDDAPGFFTDPDFVPPGGESVPTFRARVREAFEQLARDYATKVETLLVVTHGMVCQAFVHEFFGPEASEGVGSANTMLTVARVESGVWHLEVASCTAHLVSESQAHGSTGA